MDQLGAYESEVGIPIQGAELQATLGMPDEPKGMVVFAHGSGSGRASTRNRFVAAELADAGYGVLLLDLLTPLEERYDRDSGDLRFDIERLSMRVVIAIDWLAAEERTAGLDVGCYGASTGAAAALVAAAERPERVKAVVSRGGRPDLAKGSLAEVQAPTLLIVGGADPLVKELNEDAAQQLAPRAQVEVIPGAGHLFEEPGALDQVAELTVGWFEANL